ncbi:MAG: hypothetical protein ACI3V4_09740 [Faecousia sp.]
MSNNVINSVIDTGKMTFTFTDEDGSVFASFRLNPADVGVANRWAEVADFFGKRQDNEISSIADVARLNDELEEKICYVLGYDARESIFWEVSATTVLPSGEMFAMVILEAVANAVKPELEKRNKKSEAAIAKYTAKYAKHSGAPAVQKNDQQNTV